MAYGSDQGLTDYLAFTGRVLPVGAVPAVVRQNGSDWVDSLEDLYCGSRLTDDASFPRSDADPVPLQVEQAAYEAGYVWAGGTDIFGGSGGSAGGQVTKEKVDVLEITYAEPQGGDWFTNNRFIVPRAWAKLLPYLCLPSSSCGGGAFIV